MRDDTIVGYTFDAENYTPNGVLEALYNHPNFDGWRNLTRIPSVELELTEIAFHFGIDRQDEYSFDSSEFPKVIFAGMIDGEEYLMDSDGKYVKVFD